MELDLGFSFIAEQSASEEQSNTSDNPIQAASDKRWHVLIVDDEEDVHTVTRLVLNGFTLNNRPLAFHHVYSGQEAFEFLQNHDDVAVAHVELPIEQPGVRAVSDRDEYAREFDVLEFFVRRPGVVLSKRDILDGVWADDFVGDPNIVEVYVRSLRKKVDLPFDRKAIETVRGAGYRLDRHGG